MHFNKKNNREEKVGNNRQGKTISGSRAPKLYIEHSDHHNDANGRIIKTSQGTGGNPPKQDN